MFPRAPRFQTVKDSQIPGPNYYVIPDQKLDAYKRGAWLEKVDRPPPKDQDTDPLPAARPLPKSDRLAILQRKVEDLERIHNEDKKTHRAEVERIKLELARVNKLNIEYTERLEKQKKQNETLETRVHDLKKSSNSDQAEIKDLRLKLRLAEQDRAHATSKQGDVADLKKSLQHAEARRKDDVRERDRRISELEKTLADNTKRREALETKSKESKNEVDTALLAARRLQVDLDRARNENLATKAATANVENGAAEVERELLTQLAQHRVMLRTMAEGYARLASRTVPLTTHEQIKHDFNALQIDHLRTERRLANAEAQVIELAQLIRQVKEKDLLLSQQLRDCESVIAFHGHHTPPSDRSQDVVSDLMHLLYNMVVDDQQSAFHEHVVFARTDQLMAEYYQLTAEQTTFASSVLVRDLDTKQLVIDRHAIELETVQSACQTLTLQVQATEVKLAESEKRLIATATSLHEAHIERDNFKYRVATLETSLTAEQETANRLTLAVQQGRITEDALHRELEQLTDDVTSLERFQDAYYKLSDEISSLLARNELAEDEMERLSKFNAEIIGHNNPAQRILYVDRIRTELAETKRKLALTTKDLNGLVIHSDTLQREVDMYKSVMVPGELKPRTTMTRVERPPLVSLTHNVLNETNASEARGSAQHDCKDLNILDYIPGDISIDETI